MRSPSVSMGPLRCTVSERREEKDNNNKLKKLKMREEEAAPLKNELKRTARDWEKIERRRSCAVV